MAYNLQDLYTVRKKKKRKKKKLKKEKEKIKKKKNFWKPSDTLRMFTHMVLLWPSRVVSRGKNNDLLESYRHAKTWAHASQLG